MRIDPRRLIVLRTVARHGGVVGAAAFLHLSASAVSQQLVSLEREVGFSLIDRSRRGGQRPVELTPAGHRLVGHGDRLVEVLDEAEADLLRHSQTVTGPVALAAFFSALGGFAGVALSSLANSHPSLHIRIVEYEDTSASVDLQSGLIDLALVDDDVLERRIVSRGLRYEALVDDPFRVVVPEDWPEFHDLSSVANRPWIDGPRDSALGHVLTRMRRSTGLDFPAAHVMREFTAALALVGSGLAGAFIPDMTLAAARVPIGVRVLTIPGTGARRIGVVYRQSRHEPTQAVQAVLGALRDSVCAI